MSKVLNIRSRFRPLDLSPLLLQTAVILLLLIEIIILSLHPGISQDQNFHHFADGRAFFGVSNFSNVISNLGFLIVGLLALHKLFVARKLATIDGLKMGYALFFIGICLVTLGSAYYHFRPGNYTLVWDRAPMTIAFMALLSVSVAECMSAKIGRVILWPSILVGIFSVYYWIYSEQRGHGDLRPYMFVQMTPIFILPMLLIAGKRKFDTQWGYWLLLASYIAAEILEQNDHGIYELTGHVVAGHALKHLSIAFGLYGLLQYFQRRKLLT